MTNRSGASIQRELADKLVALISHKSIRHLKRPLLEELF